MGDLLFLHQRSACVKDGSVQKLRCGQAGFEGLDTRNVLAHRSREQPINPSAELLKLTLQGHRTHPRI